MPVKIPNDLPAAKILTDENIFIMQEGRANTQDIRPLRIAILNLMPNKEVTETQLLRVIGNTPLQIDVVLLRTASYQSTHTSQTHLTSFYKTFAEIKHEKFDGLIVTGAPIEKMDFEQVDYWKEITEIIDWANKNVFSSLYICWASQASLYYNYGIPKYPVEQKIFGVFPHKVLNKQSKLLRGFDDIFYAPHSRHTEVRREDILKHPDLEILSESDEAGVYIVASKDGRQIFVTGHSEYDAQSLHNEYIRDKNAGLSIAIPAHYYPNDDPSQPPIVNWRSHANLLFANWLNYFVYQETPYDLSQLQK